MLKVKIFLLASFLAALPTPAAAKIFPCSYNNINYRDILRLIKHEPSGKNYTRLVNYMSKCSRWGVPRLIYRPRGRVPACQGTLGGFYSYANHSITVCLSSQPRREEVLAIIIHELIHALRVQFDTSRFWKNWAQREKQRALESYHSVPPANRPPNLLQDELLAYNAQEYAQAVYDNDTRRQAQFSPAEKALFEYILNGKYH